MPLKHPPMQTPKHANDVLQSPILLPPHLLPREHDTPVRAPVPQPLLQRPRVVEPQPDSRARVLVAAAGLPAEEAGQLHGHEGPRAARVCAALCAAELAGGFVGVGGALAGFLLGEDARDGKVDGGGDAVFDGAG